MKAENDAASIRASISFPPEVYHTRIYDFCNSRVAHQEKEITDPKEAQQNLVGWINGLKALTEAGQ